MQRRPEPSIDVQRRRMLAATATVAAAPMLACGSGGDAAAAGATRSWQMGFSPNPPRPTVQSVLQGIDLWSRRAELAIIHEELPWTDLLAGKSPDAILDDDKVALVQYLRSKGLQLVFKGDLNDGLARESEAPKLRAAGRSITEPAVQQLYRDYMLAVARKLQPAFLGLVAESNLIRVAAPALYPAIVKTANDTAAALRAAGITTPLMASAQVETAWGRLGGAGPFVGIATDLADFPFTQVLGLSSYPYLGWTQPEDLPLDYYSRLVAGRNLAVMVTEGGWASASGAGIVSSPSLQARYMTRHAALLDEVKAKALLQLQFADVDLSSVPPPVPANLPLFASIGLADSDFVPKPALAAWDALFARRYVA